MRARHLLPTLVLLVTACGGSGAGGTAAPGTPRGDAAKPCGAVPTADPAAALPAGITGLPDQVLYGPERQGKTDFVFALVESGDFVAVRDSVVETLKADGWTIEGTDQEAVEAEAQFSRTAPVRTGTIKVQPLCEGKVTVRYKVNE